MEYPKMLYSGNQKEYSCRVVHGANEEAQFREIGLVDYADLPEYAETVEPETPKTEGALIPVEQFDAVAEQLAIAQGELSAFKNDVSAMKERIAELQGDTTPAGTTNESIDYNSMTSDQLRELLDAKGVKYLARDSKDTLISLLTQPVKTEE